MDTILVILALLLAGAAIYYFGFYKKGKINDADGDFIPDEIEEAIEDVEKFAKEAKRRTKRVVEEVKDVVEEVKDIADAAKGKKRRGRPKKQK